MDKLVQIYRRGKYKVTYVLSDGTESEFECAEELTMFLIGAWCDRNGFQDAAAGTMIMFQPCTYYDPITELLELERMLGHTVSPAHGQCKNCGAHEEPHKPIWQRML